MRIPVGSVSVELEEHGDRICASIRNGKPFEPETLAVWGRLCLAAKGQTVVDAGAYSGLFSIAAALLGCWPRAFEPLPGNQTRIVHNAHLNGGQELRNRIKLHRMALSDRAGTVGLNYNPAVTGLTSGASIVNAKLGNMPSAVMLVETRTLDSFVLDDVAVIKIDVERAEPEVLRGARETLARCRPTILLEVLGEAEEKAVLSAVEGYQVAGRLDGRNWMLTPL